MPWNNQSGGGGGPWGPKNQGPWGSGPQGGPPDLEAILRRSQEKLKNVLPGGGGNIGVRGIAFVVLAAVGVWLLTGFYTVQPAEVGIEQIFGRYAGKKLQGLQYNFPYPIGSVTKLPVARRNTLEIGIRTADPRRVATRSNAQEGLMLTGDENILDLDFTVQWQVNASRPEDYVFNLQNPDGTIKNVAESAMREVIGRRNMQPILTTDRSAIEVEVKTLMQDILNHYGAGVEIIVVQLQKVDPPTEVIDAFRKVQEAQLYQGRVRNEANAYAGQRVPEAKGRAIAIVQSAEAYKEQTVAEAQGNASRFTAIFEQYKKAPEITRERMFLETMERVLSGTDKIILDSKSGGQGVVPYLPLSELRGSQVGQTGGAQRSPASGGAEIGRATR
jgi:modulator of FtsH protease HflK